MKKFIMLSLGLTISTLANANEVSSQPSPQVAQPIAVLQVFDTSGKEPKLLKGNRLSRAKARNVCVTVGNVVVEENNLFAQYLQAPAAIDLDIPPEIAKIESVEEKKNYLISRNVVKAEMPNNQFMFCWKFNAKDPIGEYKLDTQFNNAIFKDLKFTVIK